MGLATLVLADARFPGGGHVHSGGLEEAVARGLVTGVDDLASFLHGRLRTAGLLTATFAAAASHRTTPYESSARPATSDEGSAGAIGSGPGAAATGSGERSARLAGPDGSSARATGARAPWSVLDAELDARTPSPAQRDASRAQGRATLRAARAAWPSPVLDALVAVHPRPHHPLLVGAVTGIAGEPPAEAARCVAYLAVSGPASAAIRLLGLDPFAVNAALVALGPDMERVVDDAVAAADGPVTDLPAPGSPMLDLMAETHVHHHTERMSLFVS
ncbi:urease accessory protein UreF [Pseudonocardia endophytica]|uniref:Urease accessory protein n=1 Tax=Pseudonocardia endophytica TaxID=401976 RepID=A0A4R1HQK6_PSEEN|nr:urease accessory UreF family protein [Pseudonocardia endophytica]TCK24398.1 urease accessory protein [Pseudonocardia endophytica]